MNSPKLNDAKKRSELLTAITLGASLADAARYIGLDERNLRRYQQAHPDFAAEVQQAEAKGVLHHLKSLWDATSRQSVGAAQFYLERKRWREWARRERHEITGPDGAAIKANVRIDLAALSVDELKQLREMRRKAVHDNGNGSARSSVGG